MVHPDGGILLGNKKDELLRHTTTWMTLEALCQGRKLDPKKHIP